MEQHLREGEREETFTGDNTILRGAGKATDTRYNTWVRVAVTRQTENIVPQ